MTDFLPTDLSDLLLWYDAADASTITDTAGEVSQWDDKSGNGNDLVQADAGLQPNTSTVNDQESIQFDGGDRLIDTAISSAGDPDTMTIISVITPDDAAGDEDYMGFYTAGGGVRYVARKTGSTVQWFVNGTASSTTQLLLAAVAGETRWQIWRTRTATNGGTDGLDSSGITATNAGTDTAFLDNAQFVIGATPAGGTAYSGHVHEVFVYNRVLTDNERDQVVAYLNFKWLGGFNAAHALPAPTQSATLVAAQSRTVTAAHSLPAPTQAASVKAIVKTSAAQSLAVPTQSAAARGIVKATVAHALPAPTQAAAARVIVKAAGVHALPAPTQAAAARGIIKAAGVHVLPAPIQLAALTGPAVGFVAAHTLAAPTQAASFKAIQKVAAGHGIAVPTMAANLRVISEISAAHILPAPTQSASIDAVEKQTVGLSGSTNGAAEMTGSFNGVVGLSGARKSIALTGSVLT